MILSNELKAALSNTFGRKEILIRVMLALVLFASALLVVYVKHDYQEQFIAVQTLKITQQKLYTEWTQLLLERGTFANYSRIKSIAQEEIGMEMPSAKDIRILTLPIPIGHTRIEL